jgi:hypothetical protein
MKLRGTRSTIAVVTTLVTAALILTALVAVIGSAQAAPSTKIYDATVNVVNAQVNLGAGTATLRLKLTNDTKSKQTLGSANFNAGTGVVPLTAAVNSPPTGWTVTPVGSVVQFRSTVALKPGESVSADVGVSLSTGCTAAWTSQVKQSNDFSGTGNDFAINDALSNRRPLGKFAIDAIGTDVSGQFVQQIYVSQPKVVTVHAFDLCGAPDSGYGTTGPGGAATPGNYGDSANLAAVVDTPVRLDESGLPTAIAWPAGTASMTPSVVETIDRVVATDQVSGINATSNDFDVVEKICTINTQCHWDNGNKNIHVDAPPPAFTGASLGIGFTSLEALLDGFACDDGSALGTTLIYMNPRGYPTTAGPQTVTLTFDKTIAGTSGSTADFDVCISKDNGEHWFGPIPDCSSGELPCVQDRGRSQGNLVIVLHLDPQDDPLGGAR